MSLRHKTALSYLLRDAMTHHASNARVRTQDLHDTIYYSDLVNLIDRYAGRFRDWGIGRRDLVGILADRRLDTVAAFFGSMQAGACPCIMEPGLRPDAIADRMRAVQMHHLMLRNDSTPLLSELPIRLHPLAEPADAHPFCQEGLEPDDAAMMVFTSGSTSGPKGILLSHANLISNADGIVERTGITPDDRLLHVMPLHHTNAINNQLIAPFIAGACVILAEKFRPEDALEQIRKYRPTYMTGVPTMYSRMLQHVRPPNDLHHCVSCDVGQPQLHQNST